MKKKQKRVALYLTEEQLRCVMCALEDHFRLKMGQTYVEFLDEICLQNVDPRGENGKLSNVQFDEFIARRDNAREALQAFFHIVEDGDQKRFWKTAETQTEIDIWHVIRHFFWEQRPADKRGDGTDSYTPMQLGPEPLPGIEWED